MARRRVPSPAAFPKTSRYRQVRMLGQGGMGTVYEAEDLERGFNVAVKVWPPSDRASLRRFKEEFRSVADLSHPNLVRLYELYQDEAQCFFSMELIDGEDLRTMFFTDNDEATISSPDAIVPSELQDGVAGPLALDPVCDPELCREIVGQVVAGLGHLHLHGIAHRDLKPSNVLIDLSGRVCLADFGLASRLTGVGSFEESSSRLMGTRQYMAPELWRGVSASTSSDLYALGCLMFELLTGQLPYARTPRWGDNPMVVPPRPERRVPGLPADLAELCHRLLHPELGERPSLEAARGMLGVGTRRAAPSRFDPKGRLIGRERELAVLDEAYRASASGVLQTLIVCGDSGVGKSTLVGHALRQYEAGGAIVLTGRCLEREHVPHKMLDELIERLADHLVRTSPEGLRDIRATDAKVICRVFPALRRVFDVDVQGPSGSTSRRVAFRTLGQLLRLIRDGGPLVVWIDDVHWGDRDSLGLLEALDATDQPPAILMVFTCRGRSSYLHRWLDELGVGSIRRSLVALSLSALNAEHTRLLVESLSSRDLPEARLARVIEESAGNPLMVNLLLEHVTNAEKQWASSIGSIIERRLSELPEAAQQLFSLIALSSGPLAKDTLVELGSGLKRTSEALDSLRAAQLIKSSVSDRHQIEPFHDRIREAAQELLDDSNQSVLHAQLASALEASNGSPDRLAFHHRGAGHTAVAAQFALSAARKARHNCAFERAIGHYQQALESADRLDSEEWAILAELADSLAECGRSREAAEAFSRAATLAPEVHALRLRRRALGLYLLDGAIEESLSALEVELRSLGLAVPQSRIGTLARIPIRELRARWTTGASSASAVEPEALELLWDASRGFLCFDFLYAKGVLSQLKLLSLRAGNGPYLVRALSGAMASHAVWTGTVSVSSDLQELVVELGTDEARGHFEFGQAIALLMTGQFERAFEGLETSRSLLKRVPKSSREDSMGAVWQTRLSFHLGRLREGRKRAYIALQNAHEQGDRWAQIMVRTGHSNALWLLLDGSDEARRRLEEAEELCKDRNYASFDHFRVVARVQALLYEGEAEAALEAVDEFRRSISGLVATRLPAPAIDLAEMAGRGAVLLGPQGTSRARAEIKRLRSCELGFASPLASSLEAALALNEGKVDRSVRLLEDAEMQFQRLGMAMHTAVIRRRRSRLAGGAVGTAPSNQTTDAWFEAQAVGNEDALCDWIAPGL